MIHAKDALRLPSAQLTDEQRQRYADQAQRLDERAARRAARRGKELP